MERYDLEVVEPRDAVGLGPERHLTQPCEGVVLDGEEELASKMIRKTAPRASRLIVCHSPDDTFAAAPLICWRRPFTTR